MHNERKDIILQSRRADLSFRHNVHPARHALIGHFTNYIKNINNVHHNENTSIINQFTQNGNVLPHHPPFNEMTSMHVCDLLITTHKD